MTQTSTKRYGLPFIGVARSCYREKFGAPRQPGLVPEARAVIELESAPEFRDSVRGLAEFSHVWVIYLFHGVLEETTPWKTLVRPPRLGGEEKVGVFATRSPHRPNPIGLSCVKLDRVVEEDGRIRIEVSGVDFIDGTPILDLKPYVPYADSIADARAGWANEAPSPTLRVEFSEKAENQVAEKERSPGGYPGLRRLIELTLGLDPRPRQGGPTSATRGSDSQYAALILDFDLHWEIREGVCRVLELRDTPAN